MTDANFDYDGTVKFSKFTITRRLLSAFLFSLLSVVASESVTFGDLLNAQRNGGRGLIGLVKPGGTVDDALRAQYVAIAQ